MILLLLFDVVMMLFDVMMMILFVGGVVIDEWLSAPEQHKRVPSPQQSVSRSVSRSVGR